jgi:hypothetical protein
MREEGNDVEVIVYPGIEHFRIILALAPLFRGLIPIRADIARFVSSTAPASQSVHLRQAIPASPT